MKFQKLSLFILVITISHFIFASEGFYKPDLFISEVARSVVKIKTKLKIKFNASSTQLPFIDNEGFAVWLIDRKEIDINYKNCSYDQFRYFPYTKEACVALNNGSNLESPIRVEHSATGVVVSQDGFILTAAHLVSNCLLFSSKQTPFLCPLLQVIDANGKQHDSVEVWHIGSERDSDFAILKLQGLFTNFLKLVNKPSLLINSVYAIGYPMITKRPIQSLIKYGYSDADSSIRFSSGQLISWDSLSKETIDKAVANGYSPQHYLTSDVDAVPGNSGGALINRNKEILGITNGILEGKGPNEENSITKFMATQANPTMILKVESICQSILTKEYLSSSHLCQ